MLEGVGRLCKAESLIPCDPVVSGEIRLLIVQFQQSKFGLLQHRSMESGMRGIGNAMGE